MAKYLQKAKIRIFKREELESLIVAEGSR